VKILVLEPYFDGSHRSWLHGLQKHLPFEFDLLNLAARKWKWRMRLAAPYFAEELKKLEEGTRYDRILCSSFVDVAAFRSLAPNWICQLPVNLYFHENQFAYPVRKEDERDFHFGLTNFTSALAADKVAFNTSYNKNTFINGVRQLLKICPDMKMESMIEQVEAKSTVLHPAIDFSNFSEESSSGSTSGGIPVIIWNHRWEHDKNPEYFFETLFSLDENNVDFRLIVLGQSFERRPTIFQEAQQKLGHKILHFGFAESRKKYIEMLSKGNIVVSTANHEFYGISVIEAVRAGCIPLLPNRLSYPELFPEEYLYENAELYAKLETLLKSAVRLDDSKARALTGHFTWHELKDIYIKWFNL
jgi:glycosyltransferase involved in cell wall biosynthesis